MSPSRSTRWAVLHAVAALTLVVAGSLVNSQQAALSVPDWPLSYGQLLMTRWSGNTAWEQAHRLAAVLVAVVHVVFRLELRRSPRAAAFEKASALRWADVASVLLATQILLGGAVVLAHSPPWIGALHVVLAQLFAAVAVTLARPIGTGRGSALQPTGLLSILPWLLVAQIGLGAVSRHPPSGQNLFIATMLTHALFGLALVGLLVAAAVGCGRRGERSRGWWLAALALAQLGVGVAVFFVAPEPLTETWPPPRGFPELHAMHHLLAALLLGSVLRARGAASPNVQDSSIASAGEGG